MRMVEELLKGKVPFGVLSNTHGLQGDMKLHTFTNVPELVSRLTEAVAYHEKLKKFVLVRFERIKRAGGHFIVHLVGVNTLSDAEKLKGFIVYVDRDFFPESKDGEYYFFELLGAEVFDESGKSLGLVSDILETGSNDVLVVKSDGGEMLVPVIERYVLRIDKTTRRIEIRVPEWLD